MSKQHNPQPSKLLDVIILAHGRFDLLEKCLEALPEAAQEIPHNLILVDNASPEGADGFYDRHPEAIVIRNKENLGFPKGCNQGARRKTSPLILLLNSDAVLQPSAITRMVMEMNDPKVGVVGAKLLFPTDEQLRDAKMDLRIRPAGKVQHVGIETNIRGEFYHIFLGWDASHPKVCRMRETYAVTGACLLTRRTLWNKAGGLFEGYGQGTYEDIDYCLYVRDVGHAVIICQDAVGTHYTGATAEKYQKPMPMQMNRMILMQRWGGKLNYTEAERL